MNSSAAQSTNAGSGITTEKRKSSNDPECRLDYVVSLLENHYLLIHYFYKTSISFYLQCESVGLNKTSLHLVTEIDFVLDDICKIDFLTYFPNLKQLTFINQGITEIEVS